MIGLVKNLQVKLVVLEAKMGSSTPQEVWDQREVEAKSAVASMSTVVEQCDKLLGDTVQTCGELEQDVAILQV